MTARKTKLTVGEYLALSDTMSEHGERADELLEVKKGLRDAVKEAAELWDGNKFVGGWPTPQYAFRDPHLKG
jgi:hypothetical protein